MILPKSVFHVRLRAQAEVAAAHKLVQNYGLNTFLSHAVILSYLPVNELSLLKVRWVPINNHVRLSDHPFVTDRKIENIIPFIERLKMIRKKKYVFTLHLKTQDLSS